MDWEHRCRLCREVRYHEVHELDPDVGALVEYPSGVLRGDKTGKINFLLVRDGPMMERWARLLSEAAPVRGARNWMKASTAEDMERFRESAARHFEQWLDGQLDEDHAAAVIFNINGVEYTRSVLETLPAV